MKIKKLIIIILILSVSPCLYAQLKEHSSRKLTKANAPKAVISSPEKIKPNSPYFARQSSKNKTNVGSTGSAKETTAASLAQATAAGAAKSVITINIEDGKLFSQAHANLTDLPYTQQNDFFFLKVEDADIELTKDETGRINLVIKPH